jgi:hypothetical protein
MISFQLFKVKVFLNPQQNLFSHTEPVRTEILQQRLFSAPEFTSRRGATWHIGNLEQVEDSCYYFRLGRTGRSKIEIFNEGQFSDQEFEQAPYTHAILDIPEELLAVAKKSRLAPDARALARRVEDILNKVQDDIAGGVEIQIKEITDPTEFLTYIRQAYSIKSFWFSFERPNPPNANELYVKPLERMIQDLGGNKGKTEINGKGLDNRVIEEITVSAARTADDAGARIVPERGGRAISKRLRGNSVTFSSEDLDDPARKAELVQKIRGYYRERLADPER